MSNVQMGKYYRFPAADGRLASFQSYALQGVQSCWCGLLRSFLFENLSREVQASQKDLYLYLCFSVKAVHLEIVNDLTAEAFLAALKRFIARRGRPMEIYSDNGTNFVGTNNELRKIVKSLFKARSKDEIENFIANEGIRWNFNPPSAPHFGGLWEAGIKSLKYHLKRVIGNTILSY